MLVLSRKAKEAIMIGDVIKITVVEIRGIRVRFAIEAPDEVRVHRKELYDRIRAEEVQKQREGQDVSLPHTDEPSSGS